MADREFVYDGSPPWTPARAAEIVASKGLSAVDVANAAEELSEASLPASREWLVDRLSVLAATYSVGRQAASPSDLAIWLSEGARLFADVPHDILARSIDRAIVTRSHGFMPSIGEIMTIATPLIEERSTQLRRLAFLEGALEQAGASA